MFTTLTSPKARTLCQRLICIIVQYLYYPTVHLSYSTCYHLLAELGTSEATIGQCFKGEKMVAYRINANNASTLNLDSKGPTFLFFLYGNLYTLARYRSPQS